MPYLESTFVMHTAQCLRFRGDFQCDRSFCFLISQHLCLCSKHGRDSPFLSFHFYGKQKINGFSRKLNGKENKKLFLWCCANLSVGNIILACMQKRPDTQSLYTGDYVPIFIISQFFSSLSLFLALVLLLLLSTISLQTKSSRIRLQSWIVDAKIVFFSSSS